MFVLGLIGVAFTVFKVIFDPQKKSETNDLLTDQKANLLREEYEKRFIALDVKFAELTKTNQNHLHTIESKIDSLTGLIVQQGKDLVRLDTIIDIKLPK